MQYFLNTSHKKKKKEEDFSLLENVLTERENFYYALCFIFFVTLEIAQSWELFPHSASSGPEAAMDSSHFELYKATA